MRNPWNAQSLRNNQWVFARRSPSRKRCRVAITNAVYLESDSPGYGPQAVYDMFIFLNAQLNILDIIAGYDSEAME